MMASYAQRVNEMLMSIHAGLECEIVGALIGKPEVCDQMYTPGCQTDMATACDDVYAASICAHAKPMRLVSAVMHRYQM